MRRNIAVIFGDLFVANERRGSSYYVLQFISEMALNNNVDIYCEENFPIEFPYAKNIFHIKREKFVSVKTLEERGYNFVFNMSGCSYKNNEFIAFNIQHGHSILYRSKYVRNPIETFFKKIFSPKRYYNPEQVKSYKSEFRLNDILLANSKIAKWDYVNIMGESEKDIYIINPMTVIPKEEDIKKRENEVFTFGINALSFSIKGGFIFLRALGNLKLKRQKFKAIIIYPHYKKNLLVKLFVFLFKLKREIEFLGFQEDMQKFYNSIDCLVMPSREETFGLTALEAMSYKVPVLVSDVSGICDILEEGKNGFIFDIRKNAVKNLADKLYQILNYKDIKEIGIRGYNTAKENSPENHSKKIDKLFDKILEERGKRENNEKTDI